MWLILAFGSALFAGITSILAKCGIRKTDSTVATAVRTGVVLLMAWLMIYATGKQQPVKEIPRKEMGFIVMSGLATGASWLCYYRALQDGPASVIVPIDKLSILVTVLFSDIVLGERLSKKSCAGLIAITAGTLAMLIN